MADVATLTTDLDGLLPIIYKQARETSLFAPIMRNIVPAFNATGKSGNTVDIPKWGTVTAAAGAEGVDYVINQKLGTTKQTYVVGKARIGTKITDEDIEDASEDVMKRHGRELGRGLAQYDDETALAMFSGLTTNALGVMNATLDLTSFLKAITKLKVSKVPDVNGLVAVLHPVQTSDMYTAMLTNTNFGALTPVVDNEIAKRFGAKNLMGVTVYEDGNITVDVNGDGVGAMFHPEAFTRIQKRALRIEKKRLEESESFAIYGSERYVYGEVEDSFACKMLFNATIA